MSSKKGVPFEMEPDSPSRRMIPPELRGRIRPSEKLMKQFAFLGLRIREWAVRQKEQPASIGVVGLKRGVGVSTVAFNLATGMARCARQGIVLVESAFGDPYATVAGKGAFGLSDIVQEIVPAAQCRIRTEFGSLSIIGPGRISADESFYLDFTPLGVLINEQLEDSSLVIFDLPPFSRPSVSYSILSHLSGALLVLSESELGSPEAIHVREEMRNRGIDLVGIVLNKTNDPAN